MDNISVEFQPSYYNRNCGCIIPDLYFTYEGDQKICGQSKEDVIDQVLEYRAANAGLNR